MTLHAVDNRTTYDIIGKQIVAVESFYSMNS